MSSKRFFGVFLAIFIIGALPFALVQPSGSASAGLAGGFSVFIENPAHMFLFMVLGLLAPLLGRDAVVVMPICVVAMFVMGGLQLMDPAGLPMIPFFTLGGVLLVALALNMIRSRMSLLATLVCCSIGFQMGMYYLRGVPEIAMPLFYIIGSGLSISLVMGAAISLGLTVLGDDHREEIVGTPLQRIIAGLRARSTR